MIAYLVRRLSWSIVTLLILLTIVFALVKLTGDPALLIVQGTAASETELDALREELGLNDPLHIQYFEYIGGLLRGDLGESLFYHLPVVTLIAARAPATIQLAFISMFLALIIGVPIGLASATKVGTAIDHGGMLVALVGQSVPAFWLGIMGVLFFAVMLRLLPAGGIGTFKHFVLPAFTLATFPLARIVRITRSSTLEVIHKDYIATARAKGLSEYRVLIRHAFRNSLLPVVTMSGLLLGEELGGSIVIETVFAWPGIGLLTLDAIYRRDLPLVQGLVLLVALGYLASNLMVDVLYTFLDPRIVYE
jgi:peptide/nickel transport system permease protein